MITLGQLKGLRIKLLGAANLINPMDPLASITATMTFLSTPVGQKVAEDIYKVNHQFVDWIVGMVARVHKHNVESDPSIATVTSITGNVGSAGSAGSVGDKK